MLFNRRYFYEAVFFELGFEHCGVIFRSFGRRIGRMRNGKC